jgi:hypothetical protein
MAIRLSGYGMPVIVGAAKENEKQYIFDESINEVCE